MVGARAAAAVAALALAHRLDGDRLLDARERLLEAQLKIVAKVGAARRILLRARVHELAENGRENVGEAVEAGFGERIVPPPPFWNAALPKRS